MTPFAYKCKESAYRIEVSIVSRGNPADVEYLFAIVLTSKSTFFCPYAATHPYKYKLIFIDDAAPLSPIYFLVVFLVVPGNVYRINSKKIRFIPALILAQFRKYCCHLSSCRGANVSGSVLHVDCFSWIQAAYDKNLVSLKVTTAAYFWFRTLLFWFEIFL